MPLRFKYEFIKYIVAGMLAFSSDFIVFLVINKYYGIHYLIANVAGFCLGLTVSYVLCVRWVFSERKFGKVAIEIPVFLVISISTLVFGEVLLLVLVEVAAQTPTVAKILMTAAIFMVNFVLKKYILFHARAATD